MLRLANPVRRYAWGSTHALPDLLGTVPDGRPQAELWVGAHPAAPSTVPGAGRALDAEVADRPGAVLGDAARLRFGDRLPYLTKLLAAARPLSLQVHPDAARAARRYREEEAAGLPAGARRYPDPWHKPELLVALAPTVALAGLREPHDAAGLLQALGPRVGAGLRDVLDALRAPGPAEDRVRAALAHVLALPAATVRAVTAAAAGAAHGGPPHGAAAPGRPSPADPAPCDLGAGDPAAGYSALGDPATDPHRLALGLATQFPGDPGVVASYLLHPVALAPGDGLAVGPGVLHCYVAGTALEVMAASDNVLRAGLTDKLVDPAELLAVVDARPGPPAVLRPPPAPVAPGLLRREYAAGADEFALAVLDVDADEPAVVHAAGGPRTVLALSGAVAVATARGRCGLAAGEAVLVPDADGAVLLSGRGRAALVAVPGVDR
ncbi:class I mannose-6-phosphate isomerase [Cellulomonas sp. ACRRI]|uniref:type I phosphomannose isomerase catalytic subunit n=1 Tax=Cellulomonas sp. ACRRI TaxID=2918188 RepID=UPI001EF2C511|nr:type I phosphomannose isomerase catalytic subunit [Cellulomonas sp. ACRRI]MCG7287619.1 class I mannose-6-phosphate isomerase [Cellulomonas sp. ACRRI]